MEDLENEVKMPTLHQLLTSTEFSQSGFLKQSLPIILGIYLKKDVRPTLHYFWENRKSISQMLSADIFAQCIGKVYSYLFINASNEEFSKFTCGVLPVVNFNELTSGGWEHISSLIVDGRRTMTSRELEQDFIVLMRNCIKEVTSLGYHRVYILLSLAGDPYTMGLNQAIGLLLEELAEHPTLTERQRTNITYIMEEINGNLSTYLDRIARMPRDECSIDTIVMYLKEQVKFYFDERSPDNLGLFAMELFHSGMAHLQLFAKVQNKVNQGTR